MNKRGILIVFSGPSGVGKSTLLGHFFSKERDVSYSVSATTRPPRKGEVDGVNYHFISHEEFTRMIENGEMLEHTFYNGNYYGTPRAFVEKELAAGRDVILEIEVNGAAQVKKTCPEALFVFVLPPAFDKLKDRLTGRGTEDDEAIMGRLAAARYELEQAMGYDYIIVNDSLEEAAQNLQCIIKTAKFSIKYQKHMIEEVLKNA